MDVQKHNTRTYILDYFRPSFGIRDFFGVENSSRVRRKRRYFVSGT
jgi:hypothetical protein